MSAPGGAKFYDLLTTQYISDKIVGKTFKQVPFKFIDEIETRRYNGGAGGMLFQQEERILRFRWCYD